MENQLLVRKNQMPAVDRTIPYAKVFMVAEDLKILNRPIPEGFTVRPYREGDKEAWVSIVCDAEEIESRDEMRDYFEERHAPYAEEMKARCFFVENARGEAVATATAWFESRKGDGLPTLYWFSVKKEYQNAGIGNALLDKVLAWFIENGETPVYLGSKTTSYNALLMYRKRGFRLIKNRRGSFSENGYRRAMKILKTALSAEDYDFLKRESTIYRKRQFAR